MNQKPKFIPARSSPGLTRTAPSVQHQGGGDKYATGTDSWKNIRGRDFISIGTWNVRTLAQTGKLQELTHELERYTWHIVGLCETKWKNLGKHRTTEGHILYYIGELDKHANGVGLLVNKSIINSILGWYPISSRLISIRLRATPFNITVVQVYAPTTDYDDDQVEEFYTQLQNIADQVDKNDTLIIQGEWNAKVGADALKDWTTTAAAPPVMIQPMKEDFEC